MGHRNKNATLYPSGTTPRKGPSPLKEPIAPADSLTVSLVQRGLETWRSDQKRTLWCPEFA